MRLAKLQIIKIRTVKTGQVSTHKFGQTVITYSLINKSISNLFLFPTASGAVCRGSRSRMYGTKRDMVKTKTHLDVSKWDFVRKRLFAGRVRERRQRYWARKSINKPLILRLFLDYSYLWIRYFRSTKKKKKKTHFFFSMFSLIRIFAAKSKKESL